MIRAHSLGKSAFSFVMLAASFLSFAAEPIRIGVAVGITGANSGLASSIIQSSQLAVEEINAAGGILGRKVELEIADDGSSASGAEKAFEALIFQKKVSVVIAAETSAARNAVLPIVTRGNVPYIYTSFYEGRSCNPWLYVNGWVPEQQVAPVVDYFTKEKKARSYFLIGNDYAFGRGMLEYTANYVKKTGGRVVGEEYLPVDGADWTGVIAKIRSSKPDVIISATAGGAPNISLARQLRDAAVSVPYGNLSLDEGTAKSMGSNAAGIYIAASYLVGIDSPENKAFLTRSMIKFGANLTAPNEFSVPQYEGFFLFKAAVERARSVESGKVIRALAEVTHKGPRGVIGMSKGRHAPLAMRLGQVRSNGSVRVLQTFPSVDPGDQCPNLR